MLELTECLRIYSLIDLYLYCILVECWNQACVQIWHKSEWHSRSIMPIHGRGFQFMYVLNEAPSKKILQSVSCLTPACYQPHQNDLLIKRKVKKQQTKWKPKISSLKIILRTLFVYNSIKILNTCWLVRLFEPISHFITNSKTKTDKFVNMYQWNQEKRN